MSGVQVPLAGRNTVQGSDESAWLDKYPPFQLEGQHQARADLINNIRALHRCLREVGMPRELFIQPEGFPADDHLSGELNSLQLHPLEGVAGFSKFMPAVRSMWERMREVSDIDRSAGGGFGIPNLDDNTMRAGENALLRSGLPALTIYEGRFHISHDRNWKAKKIFDEEYKRMAVSFLYGYAMPTEAVKTMYQSQDSQTLPCYLKDLMTLFKIVYTHSRLPVSRSNAAVLAASNKRKFYTYVGMCQGKEVGSGPADPQLTSAKVKISHMAFAHNMSFSQAIANPEELAAKIDRPLTNDQALSNLMDFLRAGNMSK